LIEMLQNCERATFTSLLDEYFISKVANDVHNFDDRQLKKFEGDSKRTYYSWSKQFG